MLHELLLALSGNSGGIFVHKTCVGLQVCARNNQLNAAQIKLTLN